MDLFRDIKKGEFGKNPKLKAEAKHELKELGGEKAAEAHEKRVKMAKKMNPKSSDALRKFSRINPETGRPLYHMPEGRYKRIGEDYIRQDDEPSSVIHG